MIKEQGLFSNRYLTRRGKENHNHNNMAHRHGDEIDFPLAFTSTKVISKQRSSISVKKMKNEQKKNETKVKEEEESKMAQVGKLQKQLREAKDQLRKVNKDLQSKTIQYQNYINELTNELKQKQDTIAKQSSRIKDEMKRVSLQTASSQRYAQTIKNQIYWLLNIFMKLQETHCALDSLKDQVSNNFLSFKAYIQQFDIEKQLQQLAEASSRGHVKQSNLLDASSILKVQKNVSKKINTDSMFTEDIQELNMIKIMELHPLIETFNNQQNFVEEGNYVKQNSNDKMERITKKLFDDSPLFKQYGASSNVSMSVVSNSKQLESKEQHEQQNDGDIDLPREVMVVANFVPDDGQQNFITLIQGEMLKLLRKVRDKLWIGEFKQKIGLVLESSFQLQ